MAVQPKLGILAQRRDRNDPLDCLDSLVAWARLAHLKTNDQVGTSQQSDLSTQTNEIVAGGFV